MKTVEYSCPYFELDLAEAVPMMKRDPVFLKSKLHSLNLPSTIQCVFGSLKQEDSELTMVQVEEADEAMTTGVADEVKPNQGSRYRLQS